MSCDKYQLLTMPDNALLALCRRELCRGTGPGGQKRNKTSTAVRLTHIESGISARDDTTRSQHTNLGCALRKLRLELAVSLPAPPEAPPGLALPPLEPVPTAGRQLHPLWLARTYELLQRHGFQLAPSAEEAGCTSSRLAKILRKDLFLWQHILQQRQLLKLPPLL